MTFLHSVDATSRRESKGLLKSTTPASNNGEPSQPVQLTSTSQNVTVSDDEPSSPLQRASKLLRDLNAQAHFNIANLEQLHDLSARATGAISTPPADSQARGVNGPPPSAESSSTMGFTRLNQSALDQVVYPLGTNNSIDPMFGDQVGHIPYPIPPKELDPADPRRMNTEGRKKNTCANPGWSRSPQILLVEDDSTCRQIGSKFLYSFSCKVESAVRSDLDPPLFLSLSPGRDGFLC
jgi:osomolarity two-component system, response regulator SKN7